MTRYRNRDESRKIFLKSAGKMTDAEIAKKVGLSAKTVTHYKYKDKWRDILSGERQDLPYLKTNQHRQPKEARAPKGNQYAKGNKGNTKKGPRAKNALKHGLYETISHRYLTDEEKELVNDIMNQEFDPVKDLEETIVELKIRQRRMMRRIQELEDGLNESEKRVLKKYGHVSDKKVLVESEEENVTPVKINQILQIEDALTKVTDQLIKAIEKRNLILRDTTYINENLRLRNQKLVKEIEMFDSDEQIDNTLEVRLVSVAPKDRDGDADEN